MFWRFKLEGDHTWASGVPVDATFSFHDDNKGKLRLVIHPDGRIQVKDGYAWDGCSPKFSIFDLFYIGTPDGVMNVRTGKPKTYCASLVHDALYQFMDHPDMPYSRAQMDRFFRVLMKDADFRLGGLYWLAVRVFGGIYHWIAGLFTRTKRRPETTSEPRVSDTDTG